MITLMWVTIVVLLIVVIVMAYVIWLFLNAAGQSLDSVIQGFGGPSITRKR